MLHATVHVAFHEGRKRPMSPCQFEGVRAIHVHDLSNLRHCWSIVVIISLIQLEIWTIYSVTVK